MTNTFNATTYAWRADVDYRQAPELYRVGKGEQGVLICEPYKSEILPYWQFKTPTIARKSSTTIYKLFLAYLVNNDFVGADMARKYLQMGFTRARRYTNYRGGVKYSATGAALPKGTGDSRKALSAQIFYAQWQAAEQHPQYAAMKQAWKKQYG